jgi:hypothetical protein
MKREGVRVSADISFPSVKVPGKLRWFTPEEVDRILSELAPKKEFVAERGKIKGVKIGLSAVVQQQRQDAYDLAVTLLDTGARLSEIGTIPCSCATCWRTRRVERTENSGPLPCRLQGGDYRWTADKCAEHRRRHICHLNT